MNYAKTPTSAEVFAVIKARHHDELEVFGTISHPEGDYYRGDENRALMMTSYGFKGKDFPLLEVRNEWTLGAENPVNRIDETFNYWLCTGFEDDS